MQEPEPQTPERPVPERFNSPEYQRVIAPGKAAAPCLIAPGAMALMRHAAEAAWPREACGLLIGRMGADGWQVSDARETANLNTERAADRFILDPVAYQQTDAELRGSGREIIGIWHSHPDCPARPSPTDLASAWEGFAYVIVSVYQARTADVACWALDGAGKQFQAVDIHEARA